MRVFDFLEANGTAYIVMQLLQGETLESRLTQAGTLPPAAIDRILWPLLDGLEQVHNAGFLHRDIKPANILLDAAGHPTLIDFGASRAAMAGRSTALTAIFTPGYAAAEQMTSAKQGPWTDIYGLSATLYHAITGSAPPSAFDRMLDDAYEPLAQVGAIGLLAAACWPVSMPDWPCVPATGRRASPAGGRSWARSRRPVADATVAITQVAAGGASCRCRHRRLPRRRCRLRSGASAGGSASRPPCCSAAGRRLLRAGRRQARGPRWRPVVAGEAAQDAQLAAEAQRLKDQEELARLRADNERRLKAEQEAAQRKQIEEETRRKIEAEMADKKRLRRTKLARRPTPRPPRRNARKTRRGRRREADAAAQRQAEEAREEARRSGRERPAIDGARPPACPGRADGARLRHRQYQRYLRQPHARG